MEEINIDDFVSQHRNAVARQIRGFRERKGYSQDVLAEIMGVNRSTISKIENGRFSFSIDYLSKLSIHLNFNFSLVESK